MNEIIDQIMAIIAPALITTIGILVSWGLHEVRKFVKSKMNNEFEIVLVWKLLL
jgi:hypothetical protein